MIHVGIFEPGKPARFEDVENELEPIQELVGGYFQILPLSPDGLTLVCNEYGKNENLPNNRRVLGRYGFDDIHGTFFIGRIVGEEFASITPEDEHGLKDWLPGAAFAFSGPDLFDRKIVKRERSEDGSETVTFECGHVAIFVIPTTQDVYGCAQCVNAYLDAERDPLAGAPGFWKNEQSGVLAPVVEKYLLTGKLSAEEIPTMRAYLRQWIQAPIWRDWEGRLERLRRDVETIYSTTDLNRWLEDALNEGIDPL